MQEIVEQLGPAAILEQTAEECAELNQACLKLARKIRGENPTPVDMMTCLDNLCEEMADVLLCIEAIKEVGLINPRNIDSTYEFKLNRWKERLNNRK